MALAVDRKVHADHDTARLLVDHGEFVETVEVHEVLGPRHAHIIIGTKLWPPASGRASPPSRFSSASASSKRAGR